MLTINGWTVLSHPLFLDQWEKLIEAVEALQTKKLENYQKSAEAKLLAALVHLAGTGFALSSATAVSGSSSAIAAPARLSSSPG